MTRNSRDLVKDFFEGNPTERPPFFPWVCSFAAKLEQVPSKSMLSDPGILSRALTNSHKLFGYDVILNHFDPSLEAEGCGCKIEWQDDNWPPFITGHPLEDGTDFYDLNTENIEKKGRIPVILEATKRLILTKGKEVPIAAMVTGPLTLAKRLKGKEFARQIESEDDEALDLVEDAGSICLKLCRIYCESGVDIIVIAEDMHDLVLPDVSLVLSSPLKSIFNVIKFYELNCILIGKTNSDDQAISMYGLGADAVSVSGKINFKRVQDKAREKSRGFSVTIPDTVFNRTDKQTLDEINQAVKSRQTGLFYTSEWEVPQETDVNTMHDIMNIMLGK